MKLIGITGKAGSGKTTFSNMLAQKDGIGVIHIDDILKVLKLKYFKKLMKQDKNGEKTKVDSKLKTILYKNKIIFKMFMVFRAQLIEKTLKQEINKLEKQGKKIILIDDIFLQYQKCYKDISTIFLIERPFVERRKSLMQRESLSKEEVVSYDIAHVSGNYKEKIKNKKVFKINNNQTKEELIAQTEKIYNENFVPIRKRYKVAQIKGNNIQCENKRITSIREQGGR